MRCLGWQMTAHSSFEKCPASLGFYFCSRSPVLPPLCLFVAGESNSISDTPLTLKPNVHLMLPYDLKCVHIMLSSKGGKILM